MLVDIIELVHFLTESISLKWPVLGDHENAESPADQMRDDSESTTSDTSHTEYFTSSAEQDNDDEGAHDKEGRYAAEATDDDSKHNAFTRESRVFVKKEEEVTWTPLVEREKQTKKKKCLGEGQH